MAATDQPVSQRVDAANRVEAAREVASRITPPAEPVDGDCLDWAPRVTAKMADAGLDARTRTVIGWTEFLGQRVIGFLHHVTITGQDQVVTDLTARQFNPNLPACWVAPFGEYTTSLAQASGCVEVTLADEPRSAVP